MTKPLTSIDALVREGLIGPAEKASLAPVVGRYALAITPGLAGLIRSGDANDPIARQFVPSAAELVTRAEERSDPIGDAVHMPVVGVVHRHRDRVLLKAVSSCPVYCRFCFRRESVGPGRAKGLSPRQLESAFSYIARHQEIWEVIVTGGDPFILSPRRARLIASTLAAIDHVKIVRWHTRVPVTDPARVTGEFARAIVAGGAATWVAIHVNHLRELHRDARQAIAGLSLAGIALVSQTVLLKGVNDNASTLELLLRELVSLGVKPYYLHHPDLAPGTSHFRVTIAEGIQLMHDLRGRLSGLATPSYVLDLPGGFGKIPLESTNVERVSKHRYRIRDYEGRWHAYPPECDA